MLYEVISKVASGTFGTVYKVQDSESKQIFALKLIHENYKTPKELKRIKRGFESAQKVSHPNCVRMIDWYENGNDIGFVMEFVENFDGLTQSEAINGNSNSKSESLTKSQTLTEIISKIIQISNGLEALHQKGIVHRDLKPANILETKEGQIKITDFDLVKLDDASTMTVSGAFLGTAKYSSPEQCQSSKNVDFRSDLYSLGILFYEMVTGRTPFEGSSLAEIALAHIRTPLISPKQFVPDLPNEIDSIISKLLKKDPNERFESAQKVSNLLHTFLTKGEIPNLEVFNDFLLSPGFIGRRKEFTELNKIYSEVSNGKLKTVLLSGEQGVGKTKFWKEFKLGLTQNSELIFETVCRKNGKVFEPLQPILTKCLDQIENFSAKEQAEKIGKLGKDLARINPQIEQSLFFKHLLEIPILKGKDSQLRIFEAFLNFLENIQKEKSTLVFFFDDLQWIDDESLKFLSFLARSFVKNSVLIIGTVRKGESEKIQSEIKETEIFELESFILEEVRELLTQMFGKSDPVNTQFCEEILTRTGGNVLFIKELMFHLLETKKLKRREGNWDLSEENFSELKLPKSIQSVVVERLNFLEKEFLELLEIGSLLGNYFTSKVVAGIAALEENEIESKLTNPTLEGILEKTETGNFEFTNDSFRESLSNTINATTKKSYHKKIAFYLEENYSESVVLEELANHFFEANVEEKAFDYCFKNAKRYHEIQLFPNSYEYFLKILELIEKLQNDKILIEVYLNFGKTLVSLNKIQEASGYYEKALKLLKIPSSEMAELFVGMGEVNRNLRKNENANKYFEKALEIYEKIEEVEKICATHYAIGHNNSVNFNFEKAIEHSDKLKIIAEDLGSQEFLGLSYNLKGHIRATQRNYSEGIELLLKALKIQSTLDDKSRLISTNYFLAVSFLETKNFESAAKHFRKSLFYAKEIGFSTAISHSTASLGFTYFLWGKYDDAIQTTKESITLSNRFRDLMAMKTGPLKLAKIYNTVGYFEESEKLLKEQIRFYTKEANSNLRIVSDHYILLADLCISSKRYREALNFLDKVISVLEKGNDPNGYCELRFLKSVAHFKLLEFEEAKKFCKETIINSENLNHPENFHSQAKILKLLIDFKIHDKTKAIDDLFALKKSEKLNEIKFEIDFELCKIYSETKLPILLEKGIDFVKLKNETISFFEKQFKEKAKFTTKKKIETLKSFDFKSNEVYPELISSLTNWMNPESVFDELLKFLLKETNAGSCQIILKNKKGFEPIAITSNLNEEEIEFSTTVLKQAIEDEKPTLLKNVLEIPELKENESVMGKIFLSVIAVPLKVKNKIIGALYLDRVKIEKGYFTNSELEQVETIANILSPALERQSEAVKMKIQSEIHKLGIFVGNSPQMQDVYSEIEEAAKVNFAVYIHGETGTGKELVANSLHQLSLRRNEPFVAINCSAIPKDLAESELFGHTKGSFSGATSDKKGKFELANKGTIFLDEIAELSLDIQAKLLRAIQEKEVWKVGAEKATKINSRIVIATHKNLEEEVKRGSFRKDLFYRIAFLKIELPPLRERSEDIIPLCYHFLRKFNEETGKKLKGFTQGSINTLVAQSWEGNVRELENFIALCFVKSKTNSLISLRDLAIKNLKTPKETKPTKPNLIPQKTELEEKLSGDYDLNEKIGFLEKHLVVKALKKNNFHLMNTYKELGVNNKRLDRILKKHNIDISELKESTL